MKYFFYAILGIIGISITGVLLKAVLFPVTVANTAINSATGVVNKTLDSTNVLHNYEWFYDVNAQIVSRIGQIREHSSMLSGETDKAERSRIKMELSAMRQSCRDMVTKYNANTEKANRSIFKSNDLPESINVSKCEV